MTRLLVAFVAGVLAGTTALIALVEWGRRQETYRA